MLLLMCLKIVMRGLEPIWLQQGKYCAHFQDKEFTIDSLIPLGSTMLPERDMSRANADCVEDSEIPLKEVISYLEELTAPLPYK